MNYYEHHLGDYLRDTAHLSMLEDGAYRRLLDAYYIREAPLPAELRDVFRLVRAQSKQDREAVETVLREFFSTTPDGWVHGRCDREIARFQDKQRKAKASAEARWSHRKPHSEGNANASPNASPNAMRTHSDGNAPRHQTPDTSISNTSTSYEVDRARPPADHPPLTVVEASPKAWSPPDCPHGDILALWAEVLPDLPRHQPSMWRGARADHLRARWRETAVDRHWASQSDGISYFRRLFGYVGQSEFLTGRSRPSRPDARPFVIELEWLVNPTNWAKVHEGKYHTEAAA